MSTETIIKSFYKKFRGRELQADISIPVLFPLLCEKSVALARGVLFGLLATGRLHPHFRGRRTKVRSWRSLSMGRWVVLGDEVSVDALSDKGIRLGERVSIGRGATISGSGVVANPGVGITIGDHTAIGMNNVIWGQGGVYIGKDCLLGPNVVVVSENHNFDDLDTPIRLQGETRKPISIGDNCWLGAGVIVSAGVTIGDGCVVGAGSVVTRDVEPMSIVVGVPARTIGKRDEK